MFHPPHRRSSHHLNSLLLIVAVSCVGSASILVCPARSAIAGAFAPAQIIVKYADRTPPRARAATLRAAGAAEAVVLAPHSRLLRLARGVSVSSALARLRGRRDVVWAVPNYVAHVARGLIPNDRGLGGAPGDWQQLQWTEDRKIGPTCRQLPRERWRDTHTDTARRFDREAVPPGNSVV